MAPDALDGFDVRSPRPEDHPLILAVLDEWWAGTFRPDEMGGPEAQSLQRTLLVPRLFLQHFASTSLLALEGRELRAVLVGFLSQDREDEAYVHFVGVAPDLRGRGVGRALYERFADRARKRGRRRLRCVTSPGNVSSIAFHRALGFSIEPGDAHVGGVPVQRDYDGPGLDRVAFVRELCRNAPPSERLAAARRPLVDRRVESIKITKCKTP